MTPKQIGAAILVVAGLLLAAQFGILLPVLVIGGAWFLLTRYDSAFWILAFLLSGGALFLSFLRIMIPSPVIPGAIFLSVIGLWFFLEYKPQPAQTIQVEGENTPPPKKAVVALDTSEPKLPDSGQATVLLKPKPAPKAPSGTTRSRKKVDVPAEKQEPPAPVQPASRRRRGGGKPNTPKS